jgi:hypothetical protein
MPEIGNSNRTSWVRYRYRYVPYQKIMPLHSIAEPQGSGTNLLGLGTKVFGSEFRITKLSLHLKNYFILYR